MTIIDSKLTKHYARVWDYCHELLRSNPGSTVQVGITVNPDQTTYFHRMYLCFKTIREGWKIGCRKFLELLIEDLNLLDGGGFIVISDQHKGLHEAITEVLSNVEHRQCARHIYANFKKTYSGVEFKNMFWAASFSTVERISEEIGWTDVACETVENGIAECFNAIILDARKKPLLAMLEEIRLHMMDRFYHMLQKAEKWELVVCPTAIKKMNKFGEDLRNWNVNLSGPSIVEARNGLEGGSRGGARGSRGGTWSKRGGALGNTGGKGSKRGGRVSKTSVGIEGGGVAEVEGGGVENEDDNILEKYLVHLWKAMQDLKLSGYSIEEIKNTLSLTYSHMKHLNDYNDTIEQVLPMSMEEEYPPQTETQDGAEEIIPETQLESK
ncbi:unnamed protein product [Lactuca saligna]|uniref:MULE transposase domain-containing protein n=1 Tax=Lactuca saligna TaxID=75948 RepID=A0AA36E1I0_LACSI|nr:unnamed protein product [Lactuca saligna]